ncbi:MAG: MATE family efflux transporter [Treponema sp.]|nr:MATE family efflux transporter [Treponema sp.]
MKISGYKEKYEKMTCAPVEKLVLNLAGPSITIMLTTAVYNVTDTFFVSTLGTSQVGAVGIAFPLMAIIQAMGFFFGQGSGNYMARALGAQDTESASRMAVTGLVSGFICMAIIASAGIVFLEPLVAGLGATQTIKPFAAEYVFFVLLASPWMVAATILNQQLRFQGSAAIAMVGMLSGAVLNILLDPLFIFVFGLGVRGAAVATLISQMTSFLILFFYAAGRKGNMPIRFKYFSPTIQRYAEMFKGGVPALIRQSLMSIASIAINHFARPYGDAAIAAISISNRLSMFATSVILGFGQGFQPVCGFNYGAKLYGRVKKAFWFCVKFCCSGLLLISIAMAVFAPQIIALFRKDDLDVILIGALGLRLQCISLPFTAGIIMVNMMTQTMGKAFEASVIAFSRHGIFLIPGLIILSPLFGLTGIQLARPVSDLASLIIVIPVMIKTLKELPQKALHV